MNTGWKAELKTLQDLRGKFITFEKIMTPYEKETIKAELDRRTGSVAGMILTGALGEFNGAIAGYQAAAANVDAAKAAELRRWDSGKLAAERQNIRQLIDLAIEAGENPFGGEGPAEKVTRIIEDARQSGDVIRIRAAAEVGRAVTAKIPAIAPYVGELETLTAASHRTAEMATAEQERAAAVTKLAALRDGLPAIGAAIGQQADTFYNSDCLGRAMSRIRISPDHTAAEILADEEVGGVTILPDKGGSEIAGG